MSPKKYISTKEAVRLTGLSTEEIYDLIHNNTLPAHKAPKSGWRISPQDLEELGLIMNVSDSIVEEPQTEDSVLYVADEAPLSHFEKAWNDPDILKSTWKRFAKKAKELDKEVKKK